MPKESILERHLGQTYMAQRADAFEELTKQCPPVDPHLIRHLEKMFQPPVGTKVKDPALAQMLMIQFGVDKVLSYLKGRYQQQSEAARKERTV